MWVRIEPVTFLKTYIILKNKLHRKIMIVPKHYYPHIRNILRILRWRKM